MNLSEIEIEQVVREVLLRLATPATSSAPKAIPTKTNNQLRLTKTVVTLTDLQGQLTGIQELILPPRAVITPAARDLLREQGVAITYAAKNIATSNTGLPLVLGVAETKYCPAGFVRALSQHGITPERLAQTGLAQVTLELIDAVSKGGKLGLLITDRPLAAVCLANRQRGVRAAMAGDSRSVEQALIQIGANLLIVEPHGRSIFEFVRMVRMFHAAGPRVGPAELAH
jgi:hypothetical protein